MYHLNQLNFYITDRCDLACDHCITFNNFAWGTVLSPDQYQQDLRAWSRILTVSEICVLGGEATISPHLAQWISLLTELWPHSRRRITTNGRHLDRCDPQWFQQGWDLEVAAHTVTDSQQARQWALRTWPTAVITEGTLPVTGQLRVQTVRVDDRVVMEITDSHSFMPWPWQHDQGQLHWDQLRDADTQRSLCEVADCTYMVGARLYRCPVQAVLPRVAGAVVEPARAVAEQDQGVDVTGAVAQWMSQLAHSQPQCALCAWQSQSTVTVSQGRKIPIRVYGLVE